jgi:hypothetical protein
VFSDYGTEDDLIARGIANPGSSLFDHLCDDGMSFLFKIQQDLKGKKYDMSWALKEVSIAEDAFDDIPDLIDVYKALPSSKAEHYNFDTLKELVDHFFIKETKEEGEGALTVEDADEPRPKAGSTRGLLHRAAAVNDMPAKRSSLLSDDDDEDSTL